MQVVERNLYDGDKLEADLISNLSSYLVKAKSDFFIKQGSWKVNFVGYIELNIQGIIYKLFSYPKHFRIGNELENKKVILKSIVKSSTKYLGKDNEKHSKISGKLLNLINILNYYKDNGLYFEYEKSYEKGIAKNINFEKTIKKVTPIYNDKNYIYNNFINKKKINKYTIITECLAFLLIEELPKYNFYFDKVHIEYLYDKGKFDNLNYIVHQLKKEYKSNFKDQTRFLILNIIEYFENKNKSLNKEILLCTTNYEYIWENIVASMLGSNFQTQEMFIVSEEKHEIYIDHYSEKHNKIYDSKYYNTDEINKKRSIDYKQLFYHHHIVAQNSKSYENGNINFKEYSMWESALIKPYNKNNGSKYLIQRKTFDNLNIREYFIDCKQAIYYYVFSRKVNPVKEIIDLEEKTDKNTKYGE